MTQSFSGSIVKVAAVYFVLAHLALNNTNLSAARAADGPPEKKENQQTVPVEIISPPVFWSVNRQDKGKEIKPERNSGNRFDVPAGAWLRCGPGGKVKVFQWPQERTYEELEWFPIPLLTKDEGALMAKVREVLLRRAGRARADAQVFSPIEASKVWPRSLALRWRPLDKGQHVTLIVRERAFDQTVLWERSRVEGSAGELVDSKLRDALRRWRDENTGPAKSRLELIFQADGDKNTVVRFDVLMPEIEKQLLQALEPWDREAKGALRHLGRAEVFHEKGLLPEAAAECEAALKLDPQDPLLRQRTATANLFIDNVTRAEQIQEPNARH
jgi:hypothetical protein